MEIFVLHPEQRREDLESFNARLREYAAAQAILNVSAKLIGPQIAISLLGTDHLDESEVHSGMPCVFPVVDLVKDDGSLKMEEYLNEKVQAINGTLMDPDDDQSDLQVINVETLNLPDGGCWVVLLISYGVLDIPGVQHG